MADVTTTTGAAKATRPVIIDDDEPAAPIMSHPSPYEGAIIGAVAVISFLGIWQGVAAARIVSELFLPGPTDIIAAFGNLFKTGEIWEDIATSASEVGYGFTLAIITGIPLGLLAGWYRRFNYALDPFISVLYATPRIALLPLLIIWFGIGIYSKIAVIFLGAFFPIIINTAAGVRNLDASLLKAARSFGASDAQIFRTVALPGSVPFILTGVRLGVGHALVGVVVGELVAAQHGVGHLMAIAGATFQSAKVFAALLLISGTGLMLTYALQRLEAKFQAWKPSFRG